MKDDLISRSELKKAIENYLSKRQDVIIWETDMLNMLDNAPTVAVDEEIERQREKLYEESKKLFMLAKCIGKAERPQGEWNYICSYANTHLLRYECSKCGRTVDVYKRQELLVKYPFCHCGADMRKGEDND